MTRNHQQSPWVRIPVSVPTSYKNLKDPRWPSKTRIREIAELRRLTVEKAGPRPGIYTALDAELSDQVVKVFDELMGYLISELSALDAISVCKQLYARHEEFIGQILKRKHDSIPRVVLGDSSSAAIEELELWERVSPWTEAIRWLIEIAVKYCPSSGTRAGNAKIDHLIALSQAIYEWDGSWEHIVHGVVPHELTVHEDLSVTVKQTDRGEVALDMYRNALRPHLAENSREWTDSVQPPHDEVTFDQIAQTRDFRILNQPLKQERGYSLEDWMRFTSGLIDSFGATEYFRLTKISRLEHFLSTKWEVGPERFENLMADHGISKRILDDVEVNKLLPVEHARRDSRLLRRPVVVLESYGNRFCLYGVETVSVYSKLFLERLISGRLHLPNMDNGGPLKKAIGTIQTSLGDAFRDQIWKACIERGLQSYREKKGAGTKRIPQGTGFGRVDVFVVDRMSSRFVLVEAKDVADKGTVPRLLKHELWDFLNEVDKLNKQVKWFRSHIEALKLEYGISSEDIHSVEGVIVLSRPKLWMYTYKESLPIVDDKAFFRILRMGGNFKTTPVSL